MRKTSATAGLLAVVTSGSMLLGGTALAWHHHHHGWSNDEGGNGRGGTATNNCLNVGVPILSGLGVAGTGGADGAQCVATANGSGGNAH